MMAAYVSMAYRRRMGWHVEWLNVIRVAALGDDQQYKKLRRQLDEEAR